MTSCELYFYVLISINLDLGYSPIGGFQTYQWFLEVNWMYI